MVGGVFVYALGDVVQHVDDFAAVVGFGENGVGEVRGLGWMILWSWVVSSFWF